MPEGVVDTKKDEKRWRECRESVEKSHPELSKRDNKFYKLVMGCFKKKKGK